MWLLPTLNRIKKLENFVLKAVEYGLSTPGLIIVDEEDYKANNSDYLTLVLPKDWRIVVTKAVTMADKVREVWFQIEDQDWVGILNDDHEPASLAWDQELIRRLDGKNFVSANDRSPRTFTLPVTATAWSMPLLKVIGWPIYPPGFRHLFIDDVWKTLGLQTGTWRIVAKSIVLHRHVLFDRNVENDDTHKKVYSPEAWQHDEQLYKKFLAEDYPEVVKKIRDFKYDGSTFGHHPKISRGIKDEVHKPPQST